MVKVSVIMPVYNSERFIAMAIDSILSQTYTNFEFIIIDDCSTDNTPKILENYKDPRIRIVKNVKNLGLAESLNFGISLSNGEFIARMDADDISLPGRFEAQVKFMQKHTEVGVLGTQFSRIDENGKIIDTQKLPIKSEDIFCIFPHCCPIAHPVAMVRREILEKIQYRSDLLCAQDYELWGRLLYITKFANLPDVFLYYRVHNEQISTAKKNLQYSIASEVLYNFLIKLGVTEFVKKKVDILFWQNIQSDISEVDSAFCEIHSLNEKYFKKKVLPPDRVIEIFITYVFRVSKIMFVKNIILSNFLRENHSRYRAFAMILKRAINKLSLRRLVHRENSMKIVVKLMGGLGNQMFQYAYGFALAKRKNRNLSLDISFFNQKNAATPRVFELDQLCISQKNFGQKLFLAKIPKIGRKIETLLNYFEGYFQSEKYFSDYKDEIINEFQFKEKLQAPEGNSVAIHIRRGDYAEFANIHLVCTPFYYENAVAYIQSKVESPIFYVFSDDIEWCKQNVKVPEPCHYIDNLNKPSSHDMQLMSLCKHNIISNSTYSWWAAWLNQNPDKIIVAPDRWFADSRETDIYTDNMVRLSTTEEV